MHKKYNILKGEYEMTTLKHQYEALVPGKSLDIPESIKVINSKLHDCYILQSYIILKIECEKKNIEHVAHITSIPISMYVIKTI